MKKALIKKGYEEDAVLEAVDKMVELGYLNDRTYSENLIRKRKANNVKGKLWLTRALKEEGIPLPEDFEDLYTDEKEREIILNLLMKWSEGKELSDKERQKFYGRLLRRGFKSENIFHSFDLCRVHGETEEGDFSD